MAEARRILVLVHHHPQEFAGGGEHVAYHLFQAYQRLGHQARLVAGTGSQFQPAPDAPQLIPRPDSTDEYYYHNDRFDYLLQSHREPAALLAAFAPLLQDFRPDVIHLHHTLRFGVEVLAALARLAPQAVIVYTLHDYIPLCQRDGTLLRAYDDTPCGGPAPAACAQCFPAIPAARFQLREQFIKNHFSRVDAFITPSRFLAAHYTRWGLPAHVMHHIANGIDAPGAAQRETNRRRVYNRFLYLGQMSPYKGTLLAVDAARELLRRGISDFTLDLHGHYAHQPDGFRAAMKQAHADLPPQVRIYGRYRQDELAGLFATHDWLVMPSLWYENAPLVIAESLAHRRPVITSDHGGMAEMITHGENGLRARPGCAVSLADCMQEAIQQRRLWPRLQARIMPPPSVREQATAHLALFDALLHDKRRHCA